MMMTSTVNDPNEMDNVDCKLEVNEEDKVEGYHQNESIQARRQYSLYFILVITSPSLRPS